MLLLYNPILLVPDITAMDLVHLTSSKETIRQPHSTYQFLFYLPGRRLELKILWHRNPFWEIVKGRPLWGNVVLSYDFDLT